MATGHEKHGDRSGRVADQTKTPVEHHLAKLPQFHPTVNRPVESLSGHTARQHPLSGSAKHSARDA